MKSNREEVLYNLLKGTEFICIVSEKESDSLQIMGNIQIRSAIAHLKSVEEKFYKILNQEGMSLTEIFFRIDEHTEKLKKELKKL